MDAGGSDGGRSYEFISFFFGVVLFCLGGDIGEVRQEEQIRCPKPDGIWISRQTGGKREGGQNGIRGADQQK